MFQDAQAEGAEAVRVPGPRKGMSWTTEGEGDGAVLGMSLDYGPAGAADNAWAYQELVDLRYDIEGDFRGILTYQTLEGGAGSRITARIGPLHIEDQANWPDQADHVVARLADFVTALCSRLPDDDDLEI